MARKRPKLKQPSNTSEAIRMCLDWAIYKHNRSVSRIAELIGTSEWVIYKWMSEGSIPSKRIRPFEFACDATFVTQYIAVSAQKLIIDIPTGRPAGQDDLLDLNTALQDAVSLLTRFYRNEAESQEVLQGVTDALKQLASQRENVRKHSAPELALFDGGEE